MAQHLQTHTVGVACRNLRCRNWLTLSGPIDFLPAYCRYQAMLPSEPPKKLTPAPAKVILEVEANTNGRLGWPACAARPRTSTCRAKSVVSVCTA